MCRNRAVGVLPRCWQGSGGVIAKMFPVERGTCQNLDMVSNCPDWCLVSDHAGDGDEPIHVAYREVVGGDDGEVLVEVSAAEPGAEDLSLDVLGEATFSDDDDIGELLLVLAEAQARLRAVRTGLRE